MKKTIANIVATLVFVASLNVQITYADFTDLSPSHKNYDAIIYLQSNNVLQGFSDGTFRPENKVTRSEFLKIIIEGSNIPLDITANTSFIDVNHSLWDGPYIKKAYSAGWINGYEDNTFRPTQTITKSEALKVLAKAQNWQISTTLTEKPYFDTELGIWYTPYVAYAKENKYLEDSTLFFPDSQMNRGEISEIIYQTLINGGEFTAITEPPTSEIAEPPIESTIIETNSEIIFTPTTSIGVSKFFFNNIVLDQELPSSYYKDEVYILEGSISSGYFESATVILGGESGVNTFIGPVINNHFKVPVYFSNTGNYDIGIIPGESGESKATEISVLLSLPAFSNDSSPPSAVVSPNIFYDNDQTIVDFIAETSTLKKLTFRQNNNKVIYISRQDSNSIPVYYKDFENFNQGPVTYSIETAKLKSRDSLQISSGFSTSVQRTFSATEHTFDLIIDEEINTNPPDTMGTTSNLSFSGIVKTDAKIGAFVIRPDGLVDDVKLSTTSPTGSYFGNTVISTGGNFTFNYTPSNTGRYIFEINNKNGEPILNHPIYIGNSIPLIPDFFDLNERELFTGLFNLSTLRQELLGLINQSRAEHGIAPVSASQELNDLAQSHSQDMVINNYFSHINFSNQSPDDRRIAAGIKTSVSENIAQDISVESAHFGLMRSASHRKNILGTDWKRVGLGVALDNGHLLITEEFSTSELTESDLTKFENKLFSEINSKRSQAGLLTLNNDSSLEAASKYLNDKDVKEGMVLTNTIFQDALNTYNVTGMSEAIGRTFNVWSDILSSIINEEPSITDPFWDFIGIDIQTDNTGNIHTIFILNNP